MPSSAFSTGSFVERDPANLLPGSSVLHSGNRQRWHLGLLIVQQTALASSVSMWPDAGMTHQRGHPVPFLYVFIINRCPYLETHWLATCVQQQHMRFPCTPWKLDASCMHWAGGRPTPPHPHTRSSSCLSFCHISEKQRRF